MSIRVLPSNRPAARFYRGGSRIADFRGEVSAAEYEPEDWVGSVTAVRGEAPSGITVMDDGRSLAEAIAADPEYWLGTDHVAAFGADPLLLVKLLDAGQRLPVHAHPGGAWAAAEVAARHGKTEAWYILSPGEVYLGLARDLDLAELAGLVDRQDTTSMLAALHRLDVHPGDTVHVPAGVLHAIGEGILLVELQEPEDLSILVEWEGFAIDGRTRGHLGVGFATALSAVECTARSAAEIDALVHRAGSPSPLLPPEAEPYFRLDRVVVDSSSELEPGYSIVVVLDGQVALHADAQDAPLALDRGATALVPFAAGAVSVTGDGELLVCRPPRPR